MTDPIKARRKVASQISPAPSPSPSPAASSSAFPARVRAHINPSNVSSPSLPERPTIRSTPSAASLRSTPISRARSPAPSSSTPISSTPHARITTRTPRTPVVSPLPPRSAVGLTPRDGTPVAKIRATKSVVDAPSSSSRIPRTPDIKRSTTGTEEEHRKRTLSLRSNAGGNSAPIARVRSSVNTLTPSSPIHSAPVHTVQQHIQNAPSPSIQTPPPSNSYSTFPSSPIPDLLSTPAASNDNATFSSTALGMDDGGLRILDATWRNRSPERISDSSTNGDRIDISSNRSSPSRRSPIILPHALSSAQHALSYIFQHPTASAPTSPIPPSTPTMISNHVPKSSHKYKNSIHSKTKLPFHPHGVHPPSLPPPPISPELRTVDLPSLTPARSTEDWSRTTSSQGYGNPIRKYSGTSSELSGPLVEVQKEENRDRSSGATVVQDLESSTGEIKAGDQEVDVLLGADAEEAKVNRKIADLKISNASLLAINKSLEATKSKQRTEILKLRRMLRESIAGNGLPSTFSSLQSLASPLGGLLSPNIDRFDGEEPDSEGAYFDVEMADPQLEARWEKIAESVENMKRRGEAAVEMGKEEIKTGPGRVLNWTELEQNRKQDQQISRGQGERNVDGDGDEDFDPDISINSITPGEFEQEDYAGETSREEVDGVI